MRNYSISQRNKSRGSKVWYGRTFEGGVLIREESIKTTVKAEAKAWLDSMNASRFLPSAMIGSAVDIGMTKAVNAYMDVSSGRVSDKYMESIRGNLKNKFLRWCVDNEKDTLTSFGRTEAEMFYVSLDGLKESSRRVIVTSVKVFLNWAYENYGVKDRNPFDGVRMAKKEKRFKGFWTDEQIELILDSAADPTERCFLAIMALAGLRHFEAAGFGPSYVDGDTLHFVGKGNKEAFLPISDRLKEELSKVEISEGMFGRYADNDSANSRIRRCVIRAGLDAKDATCHKFRHSFISNLARNGVDVKSLQQLARHEDAAMTLNYYTHFHTDDLVKAINAKKEG